LPREVKEKSGNLADDDWTELPASASSWRQERYRRSYAVNGLLF
jgi:hypothetical protein